MPKLFTRLMIVLLVFALVACAEAQPAPEGQQDQEAAPAAAAPAEEEASVMEGNYQEAPMLAERVSAGDLPPVDDRLPNEPFVVGPGVLIAESDLPNWEPGQYGGTIRAAHAVADWAPDVFVMLDEPLLSAPGIGVQDIRGNVAKDFEVNADNTEFTFHLREGLKWSDGEPVTTEDVRFTYEDILLNQDIIPVFPQRFRTGFSPEGEPMSLEIIDDYTFKVTFPESYGGFLRALTIEGWVGYTELINPAHILKQYHPTYTPIEDLQPMMDEMGLTNEWWQLFGQKRCQNWDATNPRCIGYPTLNPWISVEASTGVLSFERNPYYYKVDTEGQQLPYVDKIVSVQSEDVEAVNLKVLTGDVDFLRESTALVKVPLYKENEEQANFRVHLLDMHVDSTVLQLNQSYADPVWREVSQDLRFRQAASLSVNRSEIIESIYFGFASPPLVTVGEEFSQYDPDRANALLDEMGMTERGSNGFRLSPSGEPFTMLIETGANAPDQTPVAELIGEYLKAVGIDAQVKQIDSQLAGQKQNANELQARVHWTNDQGWDSNWTQGAVDDSRLWFLWFTTNGEEGEEPPAWAQEAFTLDKARWSSISGSDEYNQLREEGYAWSRENLPQITIVENVKYPMIANAEMGNIPQSGYAIGANFSGEQLFFK